jgi:hypothetical protein
MGNLKPKMRQGKGSKGSRLGSTELKTKSTTFLSEKVIETQILHFLNTLPECYAWKNHTTGIFDPTRGIFRRLGGYSVRGVSDILGIYRGKMICLEVKSEKGRVRPEQKEFLDRMTQLGAIAGVVRGLPEVRSLLQLG